MNDNKYVKKEFWDIYCPFGKYDSFLPSELDERFNCLKKSIQEIMDSNPHCSEFRVEFDVYDDYGAPNISFGLSAKRPMTQKEMDEEKKRENDSEEYQRKQYEALKKKFEG